MSRKTTLSFLVMLILITPILSFANPTADLVRAIHTKKETPEIIEKVNNSIKNGANLDFTALNGSTPLINAILFNLDEIAKILIKNGADINYQMKGKYNFRRYKGTAYDYAVVNFKIDVLGEMFKKGIDVNKKLSSGGNAINYMCGHKDRTLEGIQTLISYGADVHAQNKDGYTCLQAAASGKTEDDIKFVKMLLNHGVEIDTRNEAGETALWKATKQGHQSIMKLLIDKGANLDGLVNKKCKGLSYLWLAEWRSKKSTGVEITERTELLKKSGYNFKNEEKKRIACEKRIAKKPSTSLEKRTAKKPSTSLEKRTAKKPSPTLKKRTAKKPSPTLKKRTAKKPSPTLKKRTAKKPSPTLKKRTAKKPSPTLKKRIAKKPSPVTKANKSKIDIEAVKNAAMYYYDNKSLWGRKLRLAEVVEIKIEGEGSQVEAHIKYKYESIKKKRKRSGFDSRIFTVKVNNGVYEVISMR